MHGRKVRRMEVRGSLPVVSTKSIHTVIGRYLSCNERGLGDRERSWARERQSWLGCDGRE
jgi:hypothetical protein